MRLSCRGILPILGIAAGLAGCESNGDGFLAPVVPPVPPSLLTFLPDDGSRVEPGTTISAAAGAEDGIGGARTSALNQAYHEAGLRQTASGFILTLERRSASPNPFVATFGALSAGTGDLAGFGVASTTDVTRSGTALTDARAILQDGSVATPLAFMTFAYWAVFNTTWDTIYTAAGGAIGTPAADLSAGAGLGTARYTGVTVGGIIDVNTAGNYSTLRGNIAVTANFTTNMLGAEITNLQLADPFTGANRQAGPAISFAGATIGDAGGTASPGFQGTSGVGGFTAALDGIPLGAGEFADIAGTFYGANLQEVGGAWYLITPSIEASGTFGAAR